MEPATAIPRNKQDVIISDNDKGGCMLINAALSGDKNVIKRSLEYYKI